MEKTALLCGAKGKLYENQELGLVGDTDNTFYQFFRYCFVGGFAFVVDFGVMTLLTEVFSVYPVVSSTVSFVAGLLVNYLLSTFWIFKIQK